jgi:hypothetical protein
MAMSDAEYQRVVEELQARRGGRSGERAELDALVVDLRRGNIRGTIQLLGTLDESESSLLARLAKLPDWRVTSELADAVGDRFHAVFGRRPNWRVGAPLEARQQALEEIAALLEAA